MYLGQKEVAILHNMNLLIFTQKMDLRDPVLGFFHRWVMEFSKNFDSIIVVCLEKGEYNLAKNVKVLSLGKEGGISRTKYLFYFYKYIWSERKKYDAVFVHMNQEYVILGGLFWKLFRKRLYMWRNHYAGNFLTDLAAVFCNKIFCTSRFSYTAKYKKTKFMPVGIDTEFFRPYKNIVRTPKSILFLARIAPSKKPDVLIRVADILHKKGIDFKITICGDALPKYTDYMSSLKTMVKGLGLSDNVIFLPGISNDETVKIYSAHSIFVNISASGMYDKTIFEAVGCGAVPLVCSKDIASQMDSIFIVKDDDAEDLADKIENLLKLDRSDLDRYQNDWKRLVDTGHSLRMLSKRLFEEMSSNK